MREIKFRAWDKRQEIMITTDQVMRLEFGKNGIDWLGCWVVVADSQGDPEQGLHQIANMDLELMQFTGLKDKNGKEIYFEDYVEDEIGQIWIVKWNKTEIDLLNISTGDIMSIRNNLEIKSNIYENTFKFTPKYTEIS